jgi:hypothetical protein
VREEERDREREKESEREKRETKILRHRDALSRGRFDYRLSRLSRLRPLAESQSTKFFVVDYRKIVDYKLKRQKRLICGQFWIQFGS